MHFNFRFLISQNMLNLLYKNQLGLYWEIKFLCCENNTKRKQTVWTLCSQCFPSPPHEGIQGEYRFTSTHS